MLIHQNLDKTSHRFNKTSLKVGNIAFEGDFLYKAAGDTNFLKNKLIKLQYLIKENDYNY